MVHIRWIRRLPLLTFFALLVPLTTACAPQATPRPLLVLKQPTFRIEPVTVGQVALVDDERAYIATTTLEEVEKRLKARGFNPVKSAANFTLTIHINYVRDQRVHHATWWERRWPELELYAEMALVDTATKKRQTRDVSGQGPVPQMWEPARESYRAPQKSLAKAIVRQLSLP